MLKPWREIAVPHEDVLRGTVQQADFAADITRVHEGTATAEYQDAALFFQRTFITEGMRLLLLSIIKRLAGLGGDPVIQLKTAFGGGKTHTMLAVYHLAKGEYPVSQLHGIPPLLDLIQLAELPAARIVVLDGIRLAPHQPQSHGAVSARTLWGELAWQLGGHEAYARVKEADLSGTSPGKDALTQLLADHAPCVILIDELVAYIRQFEDGKSFTGGTYDSNLTFIQALTEAMKAVPTAVLLASLPESNKEAGSERGINALATLAHYFGRVQALWKPVATEEAFEIVRRRLFRTIGDPVAAEDVCRAYADFYAANKGDFPPDTQDNHYFERLKQAYPIHPEVFDRLYEDWSSLDTFQRTRGVLKLMAKVIHRLWKDSNNDYLIQPASLPLYDAETRNEMIDYLQPGWDPVLEKDIDGERAATTELDTTRPLFGAIHACRRLARTIFLGSAPDAGIVGGSKHHRGIELERLLLGGAQPGQLIGHYRDAVRTIVDDKLQYLNSANNRYWFDTRPNLRREMEVRKRRFDDREDVFPFIQDKLRFAQGVFNAVHVFTNSADIPDDWSLRLVILPPDAPFNKSGPAVTPISAIDRAMAILKYRGDQPRQKQNRLMFMAADADTVSRLKDQVRSVLAWRSIVSDVKEGRLNLDMLQGKQASKSLEDAKEALERMVREAYKWLLVPMQEARPGKGISDIAWEPFQVNPASINRMQEIEKILKENELLITEWAPIHLATLLKTWFWKVDVPAVKALDLWHKSCAYLYLPRLRNDQVLKMTLAVGAGSRDFFGFAYGQEHERYLGFVFGQATAPILDESLLLIEPKVAAAYAQTLQAEEDARKAEQVTQGEHLRNMTDAEPGMLNQEIETPYRQPTSEPSKKSKRRLFYGTVELNPVQPKPQFGDVIDEIVMLLNRSDVRLTISVEIQAESENGFDENIQRAIRENCNQLKFKHGVFED